MVLRRVESGIYKTCVWFEFMRLGEKWNACWFELEKPVVLRRAKKLFGDSCRVIDFDTFYYDIILEIKDNNSNVFRHDY